jgi:phosphatidylinositol alpha-1,6-mannosyltransferase
MMQPHLLFTYDFPPMGGGIARWMHELALRYPERSLVVSTGEQKNSAPVDAACPVPVDRIWTDANRLRTIPGLVRWSYRAWQLARRYHPTFSWCGNLRPASYPARWLKASKSIPYGAILHGGDLLRLSAMMQHSARRRNVGRSLLGGASVIVTNSQFTREETIQISETFDLGIQVDRIVVVPLGTDPVNFGPSADPVLAREGLGLAGRRWMVTVARLVPHKGIDTAIRVLAKLAGRYPDLGYAVAGTGPDLARLQGVAAELGVADRVRFLGAIGDPMIASLHRNAAVYLGLSRREGVEVEGFGIAISEASASGLPVVGGRSGGVPDAVREGETGVLVDPGSVEEAAAAVARMLDDPATADRLGRGGRAAVESFYNWDRVAREMRRIGDEVSAGRPPSAR